MIAIEQRSSLSRKPHNFASGALISAQTLGSASVGIIRKELFFSNELWSTCVYEAALFLNPRSYSFNKVRFSGPAGDPLCMQMRLYTQDRAIKRITFSMHLELIDSNSNYDNKTLEILDLFCYLCKIGGYKNLRVRIQAEKYLSPARVNEFLIWEKRLNARQVGEHNGEEDGGLIISISSVLFLF